MTALLGAHGFLAAFAIGVCVGAFLGAGGLYLAIREDR